MAVVIISGGIGSGKTVVCNMLSEEFGWPVYNADSRVKELYDSHPTLLSDIESLFSVSLRDSEGRFRPDALSAVIFRDKEALLKVEDLVFPVLKEDFASWRTAVSDNEFLVLESATILEKPALVGLGDFVAVVDAPLEMRIERACNRTGASRSSIQARIELQPLMNMISEGYLPSGVDYLIRNTGDFSQLHRNVLDFMEYLSGNKNVMNNNKKVKYIYD